MPELYFISFISFKRCSFNSEVLSKQRNIFELLHLMEKFALINTFLETVHTQVKASSLETILKTKRVFFLNSIAKSRIHSFRSTFQVSEHFLG